MAPLGNAMILPNNVSGLDFNIRKQKTLLTHEYVFGHWPKRFPIKYMTHRNTFTTLLSNNGDGNKYKQTYRQ